jgi:excisionase family DNA binding protein
MPTQRLLSAEQAADRLGIAPSTLARWRQIGSPELPFVRIGGRVLYRPDDVEAFMEATDSEEVDDDETDSDDDEEEEEEEEEDEPFGID